MKLRSDDKEELWTKWGELSWSITKTHIDLLSDKRSQRSGKHYLAIVMCKHGGGAQGL